MDRRRRSCVADRMTHSWLVVASGVAHLAVAGGLFVAGVWRLERLDAPRVDTRPITVMTQPPAPSGGSVAPVPPKILRKVPPKKPPVVVQPEVAKHHDDPPPDKDKDDEDGPGSGPGKPTDIGGCLDNCGESKAATPVCGDSSLDAGEQCDDGNKISGDGCSSTCHTEARPVPPAQPTKLPPTVLQGLRISGETQIRPSIATQNMMMRARDTSAVGVILLCIATDGRVASATLQHSTTYDEYDQALLSTTRTWRYRPYRVNGTVVPACGTVTFNYTMR
jgi:TonB family protein